MKQQKQPQRLEDLVPAYQKKVEEVFTKNTSEHQQASTVEATIPVVKYTSNPIEAFVDLPPEPIKNWEKIIKERIANVDLSIQCAASVEMRGVLERIKGELQFVLDA